MSNRRLTAKTSDFPIGTIVKTDDPLEQMGFTEEAQQARRSDTTGTVLSHEDGHGRGDYLRVKHPDGSIGCYDPWELMISHLQIVGAG